MSVAEDGGRAGVLSMGVTPAPPGDRLDEADPRLLGSSSATFCARIERGELAGRMEAETSLAQHYGISRDTVRRALARLAEDGLIQSTRGRGTFVLRRTIA